MTKYTYTRDVELEKIVDFIIVSAAAQAEAQEKVE